MPLLVTLLVSLPGPASALVLGDLDFSNPSTPASTVPASPTSAAAVPDAIVDALRLGRLRPDAAAVLEWYATERGWQIPPPVTHDLTAADLPRAVDAFVAAFAPTGADVSALVALKDAGALPDDLAIALARLLLATVDAQALQLGALAPLSMSEIARLVDQVTPRGEASALAQRANVPLTLQAALTMEAAVEQASPTLRKYGALFRLDDLARRPVTGPAVLDSLPDLATSLAVSPTDAPLVLVSWTEALLAHEHVPYTARTTLGLPESLSLYYAAMGVPLSEEDAWTLAALRGADPRLAQAVGHNLAAGAVAFVLLQQAPPFERSSRIAQLTPEIVRIASTDGASAADLELLDEALALAEASPSSGALEALTLLLEAVLATRELSQDGFDPLRPQARSHNEPIDVGAVSVRQETHANGTNSVTVRAGDEERTFWGRSLKVAFDDATCKLDVWNDANNNGRMEGEAPAGERVFGTRPTCDLSQDVVFRDPFGYVVVTGTGSTTIDSTFGRVRTTVGRTNTVRDAAWETWNTTMGGLEVVIPAVDTPFGRFDCFVLFDGECDTGGNSTNRFPGAGDLGFFVCFGPAFLGLPVFIVPPTGCDASTIGGMLFRQLPAENLTINPDSYQVLSIDLGGNDRYLSNAGGTLNSTYYETMYTLNQGRQEATYRQRDPTEPYVRNRFRAPVALAIDLGGADEYTNLRQFVQGSADLGVGFLYDHAGDDTRVAGKSGIAAGTTPGFEYLRQGRDEPVRFRGAALAVVVDNGGNDTYTAQDQSVAFANRTTLAVLFDRTGNDRYSSGHESQAFANGSYYGGMSTDEPNTDSVDINRDPEGRDVIVPIPGVGLALFVEGEGDDEYATTARRSPDGVTSDFAQGRGFHGGAGLLLDLAGDDTGLATNGGAEADGLFGVRFSEGVFSSKYQDRSTTQQSVDDPDNPVHKERGGTYGFSLAVDVNAQDIRRFSPRTGYVFAAPGVSFERDQDPFWKLRLFVDAPGLLAIGAAGPTLWDREFVLSLDLAGDDTYEARIGSARVDVDAVFGEPENLPLFNCGSSTPSPSGSNPLDATACPKSRRMGQTNLVALHLDVDGHDAYDVVSHGAGSGLLGVGLIFDRGTGDDTYLLGEHSGGSGLILGLGGLVDEGGDDVYDASRTGLETRGLGFGERDGVGFLVDGSGDDVYTTGRWTLGAALGNGTHSAGLFLDADGTDEYHVPAESQGIYKHFPISSQRNAPISTNFTRLNGTSGRHTLDTTLEGALASPRALFVDDGLQIDLYDIKPNATGSQCLRFRSAKEICKGNNANWEVTRDDPYPPAGGGGNVLQPSGAPMAEQGQASGFDNLDYWMNTQFVDAVQGRNLGGNWPFGPTLMALRAALLSPSVEFTLPNKFGPAFPADANGNRPDSLDSSPLPGVRGATRFEVVARIADPASITKAATRIEEFLLYEESGRYTCQAVDPFGDPARLADNAGLQQDLEQRNVLGGSHNPQPFYCATTKPLVDPLTPNSAATPAESALPLLLPLLGAALDLAALELPADVRGAWDQTGLERALAQAATLAAVGDIAGAQRAIDDLREGRIPGTQPTPEHRTSPLEAGRVRGSEDIGKVEFYFERKNAAGTAYLAPQLAGSCSLSGPRNDVATCAMAPDAAGSVAFHTSADPCQGFSGSPQWGCFSFTWDTLAAKADGTRFYPDGDYQLLVKAYYKENDLLGTTPLPTTPAHGVESNVNDRASDNYGYYPGWARRLLYLDNLPAIYGHLTTVGDFVPDDPEFGTVTFQGFATEPLRYRIWVQAPGDADFIPIRGTAYDQTAPDCFATTPSPSDCFARLNAFHVTVNAATGARDWCKDAANNNVQCDLQDAREMHAATSPTTGRGIPISFSWRPAQPVEGTYNLSLQLWDRTHLPDSSATRNLQAYANFTFIGDATPPEAVLLPIGPGISLRDVDMSTPVPTVGLAFAEDASAAAGLGSVLSSVRIARTATPWIRNAQGALVPGTPVALSPLTFTRGADGVVAGRLPVAHGVNLTLLLSAVDRAGNVQGVPTRADLIVDLEAPSLAPLKMPVRMQPFHDLPIRWGAPGVDPVYGADTVGIDVQWATGTRQAPESAWTSLPGSPFPPTTSDLVFNGTELGIPASLLGDNDRGLWLRLIPIDARGNRQEFDVVAGVDAKTPEDFVRFDTRGPAFVGDPNADAAHDRVEIRFIFDEEAPPATTRLTYAFVGARTGQAGECSASASPAGGRTNVPLATADNGRSYLGVLTGLTTHSIYDLQISAIDTVGNAREDTVLRFCTDPVAELTFLAPFTASTLRGPAVASWQIGDVRSANGGGSVVKYQFLLEVRNGTTWDTIALGESLCAGSPCFEKPEGARRSFTFDTTKAPDASEARLVLLVSTEQNRLLPLRFVSATFAIDNGAPTTTFAVDGAPDTVSGAWFRTPATVRFAATDGVSGVAGTFVSTDGRTYRRLSELRLATDGVHTLWYNSTDVVGNREAPRVLRVGIDTVVPAATLHVANGAEAVRSGQGVLVEIAATDHPSGIASVVARTGPNGASEAIGPERLAFGAVQLTRNLPGGDGIRFVEIDVVDLAGNTINLRQEIIVDGTAPAILALAQEEVSFTTATVRIATDEDATATVFLKRATDRAFQSRLESAASNLHRIPLTKLFPGTEYEARVVVTDALGTSATRTLTFRTLVDDTPPGAIRGLAARDRAEGFLILEWMEAEDDVGVYRYAVYRAETSGEPRLVGYAPATRFIDANLTPGVTYTYRVRAEDAAGNLGPATEPVKARATTKPTLTGWKVTPESGAGSTVFEWSVVYQDLDGDRAAFVRVLINGKAYDMLPAPGQADDPRQGVLYRYSSTIPETRLSSGVMTFRFEASDGVNPVKTVIDGVGPMVVGQGHGEVGSSGTLRGLFASINGAPTLAAGGVLLAVVAAAVLVLRRRGGL